MNRVFPTSPTGYQINEVILKPGVPTLRRVMADLQRAGVDRGCLVRRASPSEEAGLVILSVGHDAMRALYPIIKSGAQLVCGPEDHLTYRGLLQLDEPLTELFERMERDRVRWLWHVDPATGLLISIFLSQEIAERLAPDLTAAGCPCSLT